MDFPRIFGCIEKCVRDSKSVREGMDEVIAVAAGLTPHPDWAQLRLLPYEDLAPLRAWVEQTLRESPPAESLGAPESLAALWFGIGNRMCDDEIVADMYVCGVDQYDPDSADWSYKRAWEPPTAACSEVLAQVYKIAYREGGLGNDAEYPVCLAYGALAVRDLLREPGLRQKLSRRKPVHVVVGFAGGDYITLEPLPATGK